MKYTYKEAKLHLQGKGLLGFGKVTQHDLLTNTYVETKNKFDDTYYFIVPEITKTYVGGLNAASLVTEDNYVYQCGDKFQKRIWLTLNSHTTIDYTAKWSNDK